jgi:hypothetical protein
MPYPVVGLFTRTQVTALTSFPPRIIGEPDKRVSRIGQQNPCIPCEIHGFDLLIAHTSIYSKIIKITGIVKHERIWETSAIPDATFVSFPKALGIMIVFSPKGIEREQIPQTATVSGIGNTNITAKKRRGNTTSRRAVTR